MQIRIEGRSYKLCPGRGNYSVTNFRYSFLRVLYSLQTRTKLFLDDPILKIYLTLNNLIAST